jgi:hypothetical protein
MDYEPAINSLTVLNRLALALTGIGEGDHHHVGKVSAVRFFLFLKTGDQ